MEKFNNINRELIDDFLSKKKFAVAGSFRDETKYAYQIFKKLRNIGKEVYPLNPGISMVDGVKVYADISDIKLPVDAVCLVTPPAVSLKIVRECLELGIKMVWLQPGAESPEIIEFCLKNGINVIHNICILIESGKENK